MLGWEFAPSITGGLGRACERIVSELIALGARIDFVVPKIPTRLSDPANSGTLQLINLENLRAPSLKAPPIFDRLRKQVGVSPHYVTAGVGPYFSQPSAKKTFSHYDGDLLGEVESYARKIELACFGRDYDVIHAHDWLTFPAAITLAETRGLPLVVHFHSLEVDRSERQDPLIRAIEAAAVARADRIVAVSQLTAQSLEREYSAPAEKISVVYNGTDTFGARPLRLPPVIPTVLFLGRLTRQKGVQNLCTIARLVLRKFPQTQFHIVGEGDLRAGLEQDIREQGLSASIHLLGKLDGAAVRAAYAAASVFILPSIAEPFGLVATEALEHGVPVVLSKTAGACEILPSAFKADPNDPERFATLISLMLHHPSIGAAVVAQARQEMRRYTWAANARRLLSLYDLYSRYSAVSKPQAPRPEFDFARSRTSELCEVLL